MTRSPASVRPSWFAALLIGLSLAARAHAQDALDEPPEQTLAAEPSGPEIGQQEADAKARDLFERGRQAYGEGQYRDAWDYFRQAYLLSKRPELLYNVGQSADRMRMDREALEAFELYLARLPDAENRKEVENRVRALQERLRSDQGEVAQAPETLDDDPAYATSDDEPGESGGKSWFAEGEPAQSSAMPAGGQPERQGWYASVGLGFGLLRDSVSNLSQDLTLGSPTLVGQAALGHQVLEPGLVLGGALMFEWGLSPQVGDLDIESANLTMLGAFADFYLDPHREGWHLMGALAFASLSLTDRTGALGGENAHGGALVVGGGYEWPLAREWGIGVLGRLTLAKVDQDTGKHAVGVLSVLCNATWF